MCALRRLVIVMACLLPMGALAQSAAQTAVPVIVVNAAGDEFQIEGQVDGLATGTVTAELTIEKNGPSGNVSTSQSRRLEVNAGSRDSVARTALSAEQDMRITIELTLIEDGVRIARTKTVLGPE